MPLTPGVRVGAYEIIGALGAGGMGEVYKARDERLDRFVALKILHTARVTDPSFRDRFEREARAVAALTHPNIVTVHSIEEHGGSPFLTMELVEGQTLGEMIPPGGVALPLFLKIAIPLTDAVAAAHARGITHRDLKPANVMVSADGRLKVLDFGLAKLTDSPPAEFTAMATGHLTAQGQIVGTFAYMSPEQAEGKAVDHRSDIFSLGIILYELATGQKPFKGETNISLLSSILRDSPAPVTELNTALPREIGRLIRRCLEKDPSQRLQSALDLKHELEDLRTEGPSSITVSIPPSTTSAAGALAAPASATSQLSAVVPQSSRAIVWAAGAVVALLVGGGAFVAWTKSRGTPSSVAAPSAAKPGVTVARFENRTGDAALDPIGQMTADAILQEMPRIESEQQALERSSALTQRAPPRPHIDVKGGYYLDGQNLRFQASLSDASGALLHAIEPAVGPRTDPGKAVELARQRVLGAVVSFLDQDFVHLHSSKVPLYNAYREFTAGVDVFADEPVKAITHFKRATELDPDFFSSWMFMATAYANMGDRIHQGEVQERMNAMRDRLSPSERLRLAFSIHSAEGRLLDALKALREEEKIDAEDLVNNYLLGFYELRLNHPQATIEAYAKVNAETWNTSTVGGWRHTRLATANHLLGRHDEELRIAQAAKALLPSSVGARNDELFALAALGRIDDLGHAVDDVAGTTMLGAGSPGGSMRTAAEELRAHGHRPESIALAKRAVGWYRSQPSEFQTRESTRLAIAQALYVAEDWTEAGKLLSGLMKEHPDNRVYVALSGAISARTGDRATAAKRAAALAEEASESGGAVELRRAQLAALMGDKEQAVAFLRNGFARGLPMSLGLHRQLDFESLRGFPPFDALMKPKG